MSVRPLAASGVLLASSFVVLGAASPALAVCDAYSGGCPTPAEEVAGEGVSVADRGSSTPSTLPFTGGELVLLSTVGAAALVGGTALVVAGRRKATAAV